MQRKKTLLIIITSLLVTILASVSLFNAEDSWRRQISISADVKNIKDTFIQYYYEEYPSQQYDEQRSIHQNISATQIYQTHAVTLNDLTQLVSLRMDLGTEEGQIFYIKNVLLSNHKNTANITSQLFHGLANDVIIEEGSDQSFKIITTGNDPWVSCIYSYQVAMQTNYKILLLGIAILFGASMSLLYILYNPLVALINLVKLVYIDRNIIWKLSKNDFKKKYAGASFGIAWAFIQPLATIFVFWFVFQIGFRNSPVSNAPFSLWLTCGFIPWFFFQDSWTSATYALEEYNYLVKKIAFKMEYLPIIKIVSCFFVHMAFVLFLVFFSMLYGYRPTFYLIQLPYYIFCMLSLVTALGMLTSAINAFFKDMGQLIGIVLQFGMWLTPIMWDYHTLSSGLKFFFKLNPMFYIVEGYRDCFIYHKSISNHLDTTFIFWFILIIVLRGSLTLFKNLKPHFADVL